MKNLFLSTAVLLSLGVAGCVTTSKNETAVKSADICCEFASGCAHTRTKQQCTNFGGTAKTGQCTAITGEKPPSVTYKCR